MKEISILCPTRQRAERAFHYMLSVFGKAKIRNRVELLFYVDEDDPELEIYKDLFSPKVDIGFNVELIVGEPMSVSKSWNVLAGSSIGDLLMMGNDDLIHETEGWDDVLDKKSSEYPHDFFCIFFDDGINNGKHCAFPCVSRTWYNTLGYFTPGIFEFLYNDTWVFDIAKRVDSVLYVPEIMVRHNHWSVTKEKDATTKRHRDDNPGRLQRDKKLFEATESTRIQDASKILSAMKSA